MMGRASAQPSTTGTAHKHIRGGKPPSKGQVPVMTIKYKIHIPNRDYAYLTQINKAHTDTQSTTTKETLTINHDDLSRFCLAHIATDAKIKITGTHTLLIVSGQFIVVCGPGCDCLRVCRIDSLKTLIIRAGGITNCTITHDSAVCQGRCCHGF